MAEENEKWEYWTERLIRPAGKTELDELGKQRWELVNYFWVPALNGSTEHRAEGHFHYVFKRRLKRRT